MMIQLPFVILANIFHVLVAFLLLCLFTTYNNNMKICLISVDHKCRKNVVALDKIRLLNMSSTYLALPNPLATLHFTSPNTIAVARTCE